MIDDLTAHIDDILDVINENSDKNVKKEELEDQLKKFIDYGVPIEQAKKTFTMMGFISSVAIRVKEKVSIEEVRDSIRKKVDLKKLEVMAWDELMPELVQFIVMDDVSAYIFDLVLYLLVAFGILNTIQMSVFERIREFGVMLAIGTKPSQVRSMIMVESVFITIIGLIFGVALG